MGMTSYNLIFRDGSFLDEKWNIDNLENISFKVKDDEWNKFNNLIYQNNESTIKQNECVICLEKYLDEDIICILPCCNHSFHRDCIKIWFDNHYKCPLCRHEFEHERLDDQNNE